MPGPGRFQVLFALPEALEALLNGVAAAGLAPMNISKFDIFPAVDVSDVTGAPEWIADRQAELLAAEAHNEAAAAVLALEEVRGRELYGVVAVAVPQAAESGIVMPGGGVAPNPFAH